ncbi:enoyl-CoA hydratase [Actinoplanes sp. L3-i22]|nr:enoyl-CoA hydratase [Actinoplanes sp. L3-i22]
MAAFVDYKKDGRVAYVTLNRPEVLNAMNLAMHAELAEVWDDFARDDELWVAVLTGAGDRAFSVGQDLRELAGRIRTGAATPSSFGSRGKPGWPRLTERFELVKPVIARVAGYAYGGGFELALACDIIIAGANATFALPEARRGLIAGAGGVFRLTRQLPSKVAMGHLLTGRPITARRGYELGLVNEVAEPGELDACVGGWVADILACAPLATRAVKQVVARSAHLSLPDAFTTDYPAERERSDSQDAEEGPLAFAEKREPRWTGR